MFSSLHENEAKARLLEEEKQVISEHAEELQISMKVSEIKKVITWMINESTLN